MSSLHGALFLSASIFMGIAFAPDASAKNLRQKLTDLTAAGPVRITTPGGRDSQSVHISEVSDDYFCITYGASKAERCYPFSAIRYMAPDVSQGGAGVVIGVTEF